MVRGDHGSVQLEDLYRFEYHESEVAGSLGDLKPTGAKPNFLGRLIERGVNFEPEAVR
jgi:hypothetical protein